MATCDGMHARPSALTWRLAMVKVVLPCEGAYRVHHEAGDKELEHDASYFQVGGEVELEDLPLTGDQNPLFKPVVVTVEVNQRIDGTDMVCNPVEGVVDRHNADEEQPDRVKLPHVQR